MQRFKLKKQSIISGILTPSILTPSVLTSCLLGMMSLNASAEHLNLPSVDVHAERLYESNALSTNTSDTASLLENEPGVSLYQAGGVSSLPAIHGLADDRIRIKVDGMDLVSSCANHMNPPLSYIDPANVEEVKVFAGITPVSVGGDSIAGTIQVDSKAPEFAQEGQGLLVNGQINTFYRSNNDARGVNLSASAANESVSMRYTGSTVEANNYHAGSNFKNAGLAATGRGWLGGDEVGSTYYKAINHALAFGLHHENHLLEFKLGIQNIPYQGFPNQRMDMTGNDGKQYNLSYKGQYDWGNLMARAYHERVRHSMQFGDDKLYWYGMAANVPGMPMDTEGKTTGFTVKGDVNLSARDVLRVGAEYQRYRLNDWWDPVVNSGMMMGPNTYWNINNGKRDRYDVFAEWEAQWNKQWLSQVGVRSSTVKMDADRVQGYSALYGAAANAFNAADHSDTDHNIDVTALARFTPDQNQTYEAGYAMKTRSPSVYERFAWASGPKGMMGMDPYSMVMNMVNWVGDGNGYVGNVNLKPEIAHTLSATGNWHDALNQDWQIKATPYITYVDDYIDAVPCAQVGKTCAARTDGFVNLSLDNQSARLYGVDVSGKKLLASGGGYGSFTATGLLNYVRGKNRTTGDDLYNIMPLNARLGIEHNIGGWSSSIVAKMVSSKDNVQAVRNELKTAGYTLFNLYSSYEWKHARVDLGVENLFDKHYYYPLGGAYLGQGATMGADVPHGTLVPGMGRSINVGLTLKY